MFELILNLRLKQEVEYPENDQGKLLLDLS
ncbi:hypothetical protein SAMN05421659_105243 [[Clostridium] fimetarium]|uniref:Uncharacterized protein n=1 Tax=[Clostridium] fimetarium TaxID=99656 RepID=A0A1I0PQ28_9FIRM|nr:hypothetical protein SAMN05421659_105243 [[Clostridium] fimetarium]